MRFLCLSVDAVKIKFLRKILMIMVIITSAQSVIASAILFYIWKRKQKMPKFSPESFSKLSTCHIDLQVLFFEVVRTFDCKILEGYRNQEDQEKDFLAGKTKLHFPEGKHNRQPSMAVDVCPYPVPDWSKTNNFIFFGGYVLGIAEMLKDQGKITHGIRYGGDFNGDKRISDSSFLDAVHFEIIA